jgi:hypothetical protein
MICLIMRFTTSIIAFATVVDWRGEVRVTVACNANKSSTVQRVFSYPFAMDEIKGEFYDQGDNVKKEYYKLIVTKNINYALQATRHRAADSRPVSGCPQGLLL